MELAGPSKGVISLKRKRTEESKVGYQAMCEWKSCYYECENWKELSEHLSFHVPHLDIVTIGKEEHYSCSWGHCNFTTTDSDFIVRHVFFHGYHSMLKTMSDRFIKSLDVELPKCLLDEERLFSQIESPLICRWISRTTTEQLIVTCSFTTPNYSAFIEHVEAHANSTDKVNDTFRCSWTDCDIVVKTKKKRLIEHMRTHTGERSFACPDCGKLIASKANFIDHFNRQKPVEEYKYQCDFCKAYQPTEKILKDHVRLHVRHHKCTLCDMSFYSPGAVASHIRYRHLDYRPFTCVICDFGCKTRSDYKAHLQTHQNVTFHACYEPGCEFIARDQVTVNRHHEREHRKRIGGWFACHLCDKKYTRGAMLTRHLLKDHSMEKSDGCSRFKYVTGDDNYYRLQTIRLESIEVTDPLDKDALTPEALKTPVVSIDVLDEKGAVIESRVQVVKPAQPVPPEATVVAVADNIEH